MSKHIIIATYRVQFMSYYIRKVKHIIYCISLVYDQSDERLEYRSCRLN